MGLQQPKGLGVDCIPSSLVYSQQYFFSFLLGANDSMTRVWGGASVFLPRVCGCRGRVQGQQGHFELPWISPLIWCRPPWCPNLKWLRWVDHDGNLTAEPTEPLSYLLNPSFFSCLTSESSRELFLKYCIKDSHNLLRVLLYFDTWYSCVILLLVEENTWQNTIFIDSM